MKTLSTFSENSFAGEVLRKYRYEQRKRMDTEINTMEFN